MSSFITERKNYQLISEKRKKIKEIKSNELNKECFDCGSCYPEYISINNGVFICNNCYKIHNKFPKEISLTLKNNLSSLNNNELQYMYLGGNQKLLEFINYDYPKLSKFKKNILYQTKAMKYYRDNLNYLINGGIKPFKPSENINAYELIENNDNKNQKYEKINLNNYIYKTKKRNKSVTKKVPNEKKISEIYEKGRVSRKSSKSLKKRKNHFLDEDNNEEEIKRHKSFYKEMNKLFKDDEEKEKEKEEKENTKNNINNKYIKYESRTNRNNKKEYIIGNIYNNNYYNLSETKNIYMFTPLKLNNNFHQMNKSNNIDKISLNLTTNKDIYLKPRINNNLYELNNNYNNNTYNRRYNQKKVKDLFANINVNKDKKREINNKNVNNNYIKEIKIEKIGRKRSINNDEFNNNIKDDIKDNVNNKTFNEIKENKIKKINIFFDKTKITKNYNNKREENNAFNNRNNINIMQYPGNQKLSIRNKYKTKKNQKNI